MRRLTPKGRPSLNRGARVFTQFNKTEGGHRRAMQVIREKPIVAIRANQIEFDFNLGAQTNGSARQDRERDIEPPQTS